MMVNCRPFISRVAFVCTVAYEYMYTAGKPGALLPTLYASSSATRRPYEYLLPQAAAVNLD